MTQIFNFLDRIPILCWKHPNGASITRSSQPKVGFIKTRSASDENYLKCILKANPSANYLFLMDARPRVNAYANKGFFHLF